MSHHVYASVTNLRPRYQTEAGDLSQYYSATVWALTWLFCVAYYTWDNLQTVKIDSVFWLLRELLYLW